MDKEEWKNRIVIHGGTRVKQSRFGRLITSDENPSQWDMIHSVSTLRLALNYIEKNDYSEFSKEVKKVKVGNVTNNLLF